MKKEKVSLKELIERNKQELLKDSVAVKKLRIELKKRMQERH